MIAKLPSLSIYKDKSAPDAGFDRQVLRACLFACSFFLFGVFVFYNNFACFFFESLSFKIVFFSLWILHTFTRCILIISIWSSLQLPLVPSIPSPSQLQVLFFLFFMNKHTFDQFCLMRYGYVALQCRMNHLPWPCPRRRVTLASSAAPGDRFSSLDACWI